MLLSRKQVKLIRHINNLNFGKKDKIDNNVKLWEEKGIKTIKDFTDYMNFEATRQIDLFDNEINQEEIEYLEQQANEFYYYSQF